MKTLNQVLHETHAVWKDQTGEDQIHTTSAKSAMHNYAVEMLADFVKRLKDKRTEVIGGPIRVNVISVSDIDSVLSDMDIIIEDEIPF